MRKITTLLFLLLPFLVNAQDTVRVSSPTTKTIDSGQYVALKGYILPDTSAKIANIYSDISKNGNKLYVRKSGSTKAIADESQGISYYTRITPHSNNYLDASKDTIGVYINMNGNLAPAGGGFPDPTVLVTTAIMSWGAFDSVYGAINGVNKGFFRSIQYDSLFRVIKSSYKSTFTATPLQRWTTDTIARYIRVTYYHHGNANAINQINFNALYPYDDFDLPDTFKIANKLATGEDVYFRPDVEDTVLNERFTTLQQLKDYGVSYEIKEQSNNFLNLNVGTPDVYINSSGNTPAASPAGTYVTTPIMDWEGNDTFSAGYNGIAANIYSWIQYDSSGIVLTASYGGTNIAGPYARYTGARFLRVTYRITGVQRINQFNWGSSVLPYQIYADDIKVGVADGNGVAAVFSPYLYDSLLKATYYRDPYTLNINNLLNFKTAALTAGAFSVATFTGDSWIAQGLIVRDVAERLYTKYGFGGAGYVTFTETSNQGGVPITDRSTIVRAGTWTYQEMDTDTSVVAANGGQATLGASATIEVTTDCKTATLLYRSGTTGVVRYNYDGGSYTSLSTDTGSGILPIVLPTNDTHTIRIEYVSGSPVLHGLYCIKTSGVVINNIGNGGSGIEDWAYLTAKPKWKAQYAALNSNACGILQGTNDQIYTTDTIVKSWQRTINNIKNVDSKVDILNISPSDNTKTGTTTSMQQIDNVVRASSIYNSCAFISLYAMFPLNLLVANNMLQPDGFHPTNITAKQEATPIVNALSPN